MALFVQFELFRRNPQLTQNKIYKFHSISWGFQLYKLTSFNWNLDFSAAQEQAALFQLYKLTSFNWNSLAHLGEQAILKFQLYKLTSFNWNHTI